MKNRDTRLPYLWILCIIAMAYALQQAFVALKYISVISGDYDQLVALMESSSALVLVLFSVSAVLLTVSVVRGGSRPWYFVGMAINILAVLAQGLFIYLVIIFGDLLFYSYSLQIAISITQLLLICSLIFTTRAEPRRFLSIISTVAAGLYAALITVLLTMFFLDGRIDASYIDLFYSRELSWIMLLPVSVAACFASTGSSKKRAGNTKEMIEKFIVHSEVAEEEPEQDEEARRLRIIKKVTKE